MRNSCRWICKQTEDGGLELIDVNEYVPEARSHTIIQDSMAPTWHPVDGKVYDSKSQFRRLTKAAGCEEIGNERLPERREQTDSSRRQQIADALYGRLR